MPSKLEELLETLSNEQAEAVRATEGPVLILAGAGSGKTRVITFRIAYLLETNQARPHEILALTFTNKAAREMRERVEHLQGWSGRDFWVTTFHAFGARILRRHAELLGFQPGFVIYDSDDSERVVKRVFKEKNIKDERITPSGFFSWLERRSWSYSDNDPNSFLERRYAEILEGYRKILKQSNAIDFKDLLVLPLRLFEQNPELLAQYQQRFRFVLVDEYQDTNNIQYRLVKLLTAQHRNLTVVGDEDQSIYSWRGADIRNILDFEKDFKDHRTFHLATNYRSPQVILDAANTLIKRNRETHRKEHGLTSALPERGDPIRYYMAASDIEEAQWVVHTLGEHRRNGVALSKMALFYRTHAQSRRFEEFLIRAGIPFRVYGGTPFFSKKEVKDLMAYLRLIANPRDNVNLVRAILNPRRGVGETTLEKALESASARSQTLWEALQSGEGIAKASQKKIKEFVALIHELQDMQTHVGLHGMVTVLLDRIDYRSFLSAQGREDREEIVDEFLRMVGEFDIGRPAGLGAEGLPPLDAFLESVTLYDAVESMKPGDECLTLMTVHNAKGLEFEYVFVVGMEERLFPHANSLNDEMQMEEERRLCYVAMTRAMRRLYLSSARVRNMRGYPESREPSRFLREIDPHTLEVRGPSGWVPATRMMRSHST